MLIRFGTAAYDDLMKALIRLRRSSTVSAYKGEFESLSNRIKCLSPQHKLSCFLSELKDEIRLSVRILNPPSLNANFGLAKIQEEYWMGCKKGARLLQEQGQSSILGLPKFNSPIKAKTRIPIKRILLAQMEQRKKKGLCYNCDDFVITVMINGHQVISVRVLSCCC